MNLKCDSTQTFYVVSIQFHITQYTAYTESYNIYFTDNLTSPNKNKRASHKEEAFFMCFYQRSLHLERKNIVLIDHLGRKTWTRFAESGICIEQYYSNKHIINSYTTDIYSI